MHQHRPIMISLNTNHLLPGLTPLLSPTTQKLQQSVSLKMNMTLMQQGWTPTKNDLESDTTSEGSYIETHDYNPSYTGPIKAYPVASMAYHIRLLGGGTSE